MVTLLSVFVASAVTFLVAYKRGRERGYAEGKKKGFRDGFYEAKGKFNA